jgi:stage III sporulation protein AC
MQKTGMRSFAGSGECAEKSGRYREDKAVEVDLIFRIAAIGIIVAVLNQLLIRSGREEQAMMTTLAGLIVVLMMIIREIDTLFQTIKSVFQL